MSAILAFAADPGNLFDAVRYGLIALAAIVGFPALKKVWEVATVVKSIQATADRTSERLVEFMEHITKLHDDHETRLRAQEGKMAVVWDGHERRSQRKEDHDDG